MAFIRGVSSGSREPAAAEAAASSLPILISYLWAAVTSDFGLYSCLKGRTWLSVALKWSRALTTHYVSCLEDMLMVLSLYC